MNSANAFGFLGVGLAMWLLPALAPSWFTHVAIDGSSTRALWLQVMGPVQVAIGLWFLGQRALTALRIAARRATDWVFVQGAAVAASWQTRPAANAGVLDLRSEHPLWVRHAAVAEPAGRPSFRSLIEKAWTTEERVAEYIATESQRRLALRAGSLAAYAAGVPSRSGRVVVRDTQHRILRPTTPRQPRPEMQSVA